MPCPRATLMIAAACLAACSSETAWHSLDPKALTSTQTEQSRIAVTARDAFAESLKARLTSAIADGGPAAGIDACRIDAPKIAATTATEHGVKIGRTSHRLRNPANVAPDWARTTVAAESIELALFGGPSGQLGALFPIKLQPQCVVCHGDPAQIPEPVQTALAAAYPQDRATGFAPNDLRGWFWVEVTR